MHPKAGTGADIDCRIGAIVFDIADLAGAFVLAIDIDEKNIIQAKTVHPHPNIDYRIGDAMKDLPSTRFDTVILSNVLEHLDQRVKFLINVVERASPKRLLIRVPLYDRCWQVPLREEIGAEWRLDSSHQIEYTQETFKKEMKVAGLEITHLEIRWGEIWAEVVPNGK